MHIRDCNEWNVSAIVLGFAGRRSFSCNYFPKVANCSNVPPLRHAVRDFSVLIAGKAQVHEPLFIQPLGRLLQQFDLLSVILNQVVVGGENVGDAALNFNFRKRNIY